VPVHPRGIGGGNTRLQLINAVMVRRVLMPVRKPVNVRSVLMELPPGDTAQNHTKKGHYPKQPRRAASNPRKIRAVGQDIHEPSMAERLKLRQRQRSRWLTRTDPRRRSVTPSPSFL
jgi:hypothetical protein